ncbi:hypothetical protein BOX15_Mlig024801g3 [Macrostomum lignano]|uniref:Uncharacterized protein n=1 Tax=Macrostomum lignano TaxID=282301 RepID=A0A267DAS8_9PLAT|nr:hypothetical protein BOX15_Mlig024801g3 [Macrostomum lignano]
MIPAALVEAVQRDSVDALRRLLTSTPPSPDTLSAALALAAALPCQLETAAVLLEFGANPERALALVAACDQDRRDCPELARLLVARGASVNQVSRPDGKPALLLAVRRGHAGLTRQLIEARADVNLAEPNLRWTPLLAAVSIDRPDLAKLLLDARADPNAMSSDGTALAMAACRGHPGLVRLLLDRRADPNLCAPVDPDAKPDADQDADPDDLDSYSPLAYAACNGHRECVELLLRAGARPDTPTSALGRTPLILAALNGHAGVAAALLAAGANPNLAEPLHRWTPLVTAVHTDAVEVVNVLLADRRTDVNWLTDDGTALAKAAEAGNVALVTRLLSAGADADKADEVDGHTPLMWAAQSGHAGAIERLLSRGARPERENSAGQSAILLAACNGHAAALEQLLRRSESSAAKQQAVNAAMQAVAGDAGRQLEPGVARRIRNLMETAREEVVENQSNNLVGGLVSPKSGRSVRDSSGVPGPAAAASAAVAAPAAPPVVSGTMTRLISSQTVLPHGFLQSLDIRRDTPEPRSFRLRLPSPAR